MTTRIRRLTAWGQRLVLAAGVVCLNPALAGPGTLTDVPLVLDTPVTPNVMLLADDSGSMYLDRLAERSGQ